ncbi:MAG TPA: hypothetical protein VNV43_04235 [Candidatus Acidoferrales bacterium]|jgi:hypothetical protein|nr:hypothetical protein [Candidatus Acidoferrales bacterium]
MIRAFAIFQIVVLVAIIAFAVWRKSRAGRSTYFDTCLIWILLTLDILDFALYGNSLTGEEVKQWRGYFPDGTHVLFFSVLTLLYALVIGPIIELAHKLGRKSGKDLPE